MLIWEKELIITGKQHCFCFRETSHRCKVRTWAPVLSASQLNFTKDPKNLPEAAQNYAYQFYRISAYPVKPQNELDSFYWWLVGFWWTRYVIMRPLSKYKALLCLTCSDLEIRNPCCCCCCCCERFRRRNLLSRSIWCCWGELQNIVACRGHFKCVSQTNSFFSCL